MNYGLVIKAGAVFDSSMASGLPNYPGGNAMYVAQPRQLQWHCCYRNQRQKVTAELFVGQPFCPAESTAATRSELDANYSNVDLTNS